MADYALDNELVLRGVFRHLSIPALRNCRLVCSFWSDVAIEFLRGRVWIYLQHPYHALSELQSFLSKNGISHGLKLSFCKHAWRTDMLYENQEDVPDSDENYEDKYRITEYDRKILDYISAVGHLVSEFRLESKYMNEADSKILKKLLSPMTNCREVFLRMIDFRDEAWMSTKESLLPDSVQIFGVQLVNGRCTTETGIGAQATFTLPGCVQFMKACSSSKHFKLLDIHGPAQIFHWPIKYRKWAGFWLKAIREICQENNSAFPKLCGLRHELFNDEDTEDMIVFPKGFRELHLDMLARLSKLPPILRRHSTTLEKLDLELYIPNCLQNEVQQPIRIPLMLKLQRLDINIVAKFEWKRWNLSNFDAFGLKQLFADQNFPLSYPKLDTLSVFYFYFYGMDIWEWIFPSFLENGERFILNQIKILNVSLTAECDSAGITRLLRIFPELLVFRHVIKKPFDDDQDGWLAVCEHRCRNAVPGTLSKCREITDWVFKDEHVIKLRSSLTFRYDGHTTSRLRYQLGGGGPFSITTRSLRHQ